MKVKGVERGWLTQLEETFIGILLLAITAVIFINVVMRYAFHSSLSWAEEFARYGVIWITFIGGSVCVYRRLHIAVDIWSHKLSARLDRLWLRAVHVFSSVSCGVFCWYSLQLVIKAMHTGQKTIALGLPMWLVYGSMTLGGALMCARFLMAALCPAGTDGAAPSNEPGDVAKGAGTC